MPATEKSALMPAGRISESLARREKKTVVCSVSCDPPTSSNADIMTKAQLPNMAVLAVYAAVRFAPLFSLPPASVMRYGLSGLCTLPLAMSLLANRRHLPRHMAGSRRQQT